MYIYKTTNTLNGKIYIGLSTTSVDSTKTYYGSGTLIKKAISKYGKENFTKEILERDITDRDILCTLEIQYISEYNSTDRTIGYNLTHGGDGTGGLEFSQERRDKIGKANSGPSSPKKYKASLYNMAKARSAIKNFTKSDKTKSKISDTIRGKRWYHDPINNSNSGQYHAPPNGWILGRGSKCNRPSGLTYKKSK
jgi:group I intron endonuclease